MKRHLSFLLLFLPFFTNAKNPTTKKTHVKLFASWGYNRGYFTNSAIHFKGDEYAFTLSHVKAQDRQSPASFNTYFNLSNLTIPQYNFCIGVSFPGKFNISIGQDHMKYVVEQYSNATIDGYIHNQSEFAGDFHHTTKKITPDFLQFEHTDGLNYVHLKIAKEKVWLKNRSKHIELSADAGFNAGLLVPRSDVTLMHYQRNNEFHIAGYGVGLNAGLKATFYKFFFLRLDNKTGFINMPDILTRGTGYTDRAKQHFDFTEFFCSFGFQQTL